MDQCSKLSKKDYDKQRYILQKEKRKKTYEDKKEEKLEYSKNLQKKYRDSYRLLEKFYRSNQLDNLEEDEIKLLEELFD